MDYSGLLMVIRANSRDRENIMDKRIAQNRWVSVWFSYTIGFSVAYVSAYGINTVELQFPFLSFSIFYNGDGEY